MGSTFANKTTELGASPRSDLRPQEPLPRPKPRGKPRRSVSRLPANTSSRAAAHRYGIAKPRTSSLDTDKPPFPSSHITYACRLLSVPAPPEYLVEVVTMLPVYQLGAPHRSFQTRNHPRTAYFRLKSPPNSGHRTMITLQKVEKAHLSTQIRKSRYFLDLQAPSPEAA